MIRVALENRDNGICAKCGQQCKTRRLRFENLEAWKKAPKWEADHIVPVVEGGGLCGLDGYRTLCRECHKKETKALAGRRAEKRRGIVIQQEKLF